MQTVSLADALARPINSIAYTVAVELARARADKCVLFTEDGSFWLDDFEREGHCKRSPVDGVVPLVDMRRGEEGHLDHDVEHGWHEVEWNGERLEVLRLRYGFDDCSRARSWIVCDRRETGEAFFRAVCRFNEEIDGQVLVFDEACFDKSRVLFESIQRASFETLVLAGDLKQQLRDDLARFFANKATYAEHAIPWKRGLLLVGPPGNGKTQAIRALVKESGCSCIYVRTLSAEHNSDASCIARLFGRARRTAPCVLVLEDLDSLITDQNRSVFLNELDGFYENAGLFLIATTNHPERLDRSILDRPSRFDRKFHFHLPALPERRAYLEKWNASAKPALRLTAAGISELAERANGFSFAYLKELMLASMMAWINAGGATPMDAVATDALATLKGEMKSVADVMPSIEPKRKIEICPN